MIKRSVWLALMILALSSSVVAQENNDDVPVETAVTFEVLSVRFMTAEEEARKGYPLSGKDLCVRLRLMNKGKRAIYFYGFKDIVDPMGYTVRREEGKLFWFTDGMSSKSPGVESFNNSGDWMQLPADSAIEWETLDSSATVGKKWHAKTIYLRVGLNANVIEKFTDFYDVPIRLK